MTSSPDAAAYPTDKCRSCEAPIIWASTTGGRLMPVNAEPAEGGNVRLDGPAGRKPVALLVPKIEAQGRADLRWSHFSSCPERDKWRTRGRRGAR